MELDKLTDLHFSAHLVDMMLEYRAIGTLCLLFIHPRAPNLLSC